MLRNHLIYWLLPGAFIALTILMYFSGSATLQAIVAPEVNRELGLIETVQLALLVAVFTLSSSGLRQDNSAIETAVFGLIAAASAFLALEEMDYGIHYWELMTGRKVQASIRNIHNQGENTDVLKLTAYVGIGLFCIVLPLVRRKIPLAWLRRFISSRWIICTAALLVATPRLVHFLQESSPAGRGPLDGNLSEFEETITYYLLVVYVWELRRRQSPESAGA